MRNRRIDDALDNLRHHKGRVVDFNVVYAEELALFEDNPSAGLVLAEMPRMISAQYPLPHRVLDLCLDKSDATYTYVIGRLRFLFLPQATSCNYIGVTDIVVLESDVTIFTARCRFQKLVKLIEDNNYVSDDYDFAGKTVFYEVVSVFGFNDSLLHDLIVKKDLMQDPNSVFNECMTDEEFARACKETCECERNRKVMEEWSVRTKS